MKRRETRIEQNGPDVFGSFYEGGVGGALTRVSCPKSARLPCTTATLKKLKPRAPGALRPAGAGGSVAGSCLGGEGLGAGAYKVEAGLQAVRLIRVEALWVHEAAASGHTSAVDVRITQSLAAETSS